MHFICTHIKYTERDNTVEKQQCVVTFASSLLESVSDEMSGLISPETDHNAFCMAAGLLPWEQRLHQA